MHDAAAPHASGHACSSKPERLQLPEELLRICCSCGHLWQTAIGHWAEMMFPLFSILRREPHFQWPPAQFVLLHLKRVQFLKRSAAVILILPIP